MLRLKRASAGSGKTYELAKTFIKLLLTIKPGGKRRQLRNEAQIRDGLNGIMAVTFTVKATAEMKQRIIEKLSDLGRADDIPDDRLKEIDYLEEFIQDLRTNKYEIARRARKALSVILLHYSDFKVQTIDSFFQSILHTFAYEASLDDNFNMEIDTDFITGVGLDSALNELAESGKDGEGADNLYWFKKEMNNYLAGKKWNIFTKRDSSNSLYSNLIADSKNLEKEEYQNVRESLLEYFEEHAADFRSIIEQVDDANNALWRTLHNDRRDAARKLLNVLEKYHLQPNDIFKKRGDLLEASLIEFDKNSIELPPPEVNCGTSERGFSLSADGKANLKQNAADKNAAIDAIDRAYEEWMGSSSTYHKAYKKNKAVYETWLLYRSMLPKLMIELMIAAKRDDYLKKTNSLHISDTSHIISQIIGDEEMPFVYERMGSRLNHYLVDEFQDTSRMQWSNLYLLLKETDDSGHDNLIIGDAKQSIYRFRNADYRLIDEVEKMFPKVVDFTTERKPKKDSGKTTNFRSKPRIVEFNNYIFSHIVSMNTTDPKGAVCPLFQPGVEQLYRDCIQTVRKPKFKKKENLGVKPHQGYVEVKIFPPLTANAKEETESSGQISLAEHGLIELTDRIKDIRSRGFRLRDIAILVKTHEQGKAVVATINRYNAENPDEMIPIISEENLLVGSALSVKLIVHALEMIAGGLKTKVRPNEVLKEPVDPQQLFDMMKSLPSMSLDSIVESIIFNFVPLPHRNSEAPFIAAFQDAVIDYMASRNSDVGSFLNWWEQKSKKLCITSPDDSDGVRVQTIHQAKGLEYKCVIIPFANFRFEPAKVQKEWRWVKPHPSVAGSSLLPPFLPVETTQKLEETLHANVQKRYTEEFALDELNKMYVGFTRPKDELYVYVTSAGSQQKTSGDSIARLLASEEYEKEVGENLNRKFKLESVPDGSVTVKYGTKTEKNQLRAEEIEKAKADEENHQNEMESSSEYVLETYNVNGDSKILKVKDANPLNEDLSSAEDDSRKNAAAAEGTMKHKVMQMVKTADDVDKALLKMKVGGKISEAEMKEWRIQLKEAIRKEEGRGWFDSASRIVNERPIMLSDGNILRPDRIIVMPGNNAILIDYKFGHVRDAYKKQVAEYAGILKESGEFNSIEAYLWYVAEGRVERIV